MLNHYIFCFAAIAAILGSATAATTSNGGAVSDNLDEYTTSAVLPSAIAATLADAPAATTPQNGAITAPSPPIPPPAPQLPNVGVLAYDRVGISDGVEFSPIPSEPSATNNYFEVAPCDLKAVDKNECIRNLFAQIVPQLKAGLPQYGMSSIDPYFYRRGIFRYDNEGVQGGLLIKNMYINGISEFKVNTFLSNFTEKTFIVKLSIEIPQIKANGQFKADVKFGGLRLVPKGPFNITIDNIRATILTDGLLENTEAGRRLKLNRLNANVAVGDARIIANGIFSDRNLNAMILNLVNENLPEITRVGIPATREQWAPIFTTHINQFFANVPIDKFLIE
ncbi:PREDICTED: uncharacterized protein LOC108967808 [Bactrocera latifrons]|uniref:Protein takeout n=1 Tax=Bactrocera latifrons TaxID=174628 RepID=A0A0K8V4A7_BACLA|nr:PREDICTED: uncharacterized protein LOC108967808 [Bactrocera latifrons]